MTRSSLDALDEAIAGNFSIFDLGNGSAIVERKDLIYTMDLRWLGIWIFSPKIQRSNQSIFRQTGSGTEPDDQLLFRFTIWLYSFILKFIPSIVLTIFTGEPVNPAVKGGFCLHFQFCLGFLIHALYKAEERSARLKNGRGGSGGHGGAAACTPKGCEPEVEQQNHVVARENLNPAAGNTGNATADTAIQTARVNNMTVAVNNNGNVVASTLNHMR